MSDSASHSVVITRHPSRPGNYLLHAELWLPRPIDEVFSFFGDAGNLESITPAWLCFKIVTPRPIEMRAGALIDYRLRLHGLPLRWQTEITAWEPFRRFVDTQVRGPYRRWIHEHTFETRDGGTVARDFVTYAVPGGSIAHRLLVRGNLKRIFRHRQETLRRLMGEQRE